MKVEIDLAGMPPALQAGLCALFEALRQTWPAPQEAPAPPPVLPRPAPPARAAPRRTTTSYRRARVETLLRAHPAGLSAAEICERLSLAGNVPRLLKGMVRAGQLRRVGPGRYTSVGV